ncbi:MAG: site-specific integrase [Chloroflexota bacterium]
MSRRGPHEGNIYQRTDGRWEARIHLGYADGRRRRKSFYGHTRGEVQEKLTRALRDQYQGLPVGTDDRLTVGQFLTGWLSDAVRPSVRPKTYATYEMYARCHLIPELGRIPLARLAPQDVQRLMNRKLAAGLSPQTVCHLRAVLRRALNQANRWGLVPRNVATLVDPPRVPRREVPVMTPEEARHLLLALRGDRFEALFTLALMLGLRQGEVLGLRWEDVDLPSSRLAIRHALQRVNGKLQLVEPKTQLSRRSLIMPPMLVDALQAQRVRQLEERLWAGSRWRESDLVFTTSLGTPLDGTNVTHRFQAVLRAAGLPRLRFQDLRHACASLLLAQGVHPRIVMEQLGHSQISLTLNTYSHVLPSLQGEAAQRMEELLAT